MAEFANFQDAVTGECGDAAIGISYTSLHLASARLPQGFDRKSSQHSLDDVVVL